MQTDNTSTPASLNKQLEQFWQLASQKVRLLEQNYDPDLGSPVFTVEGRYTTRGWTEWTQGFQYGIPLLVFAATGDQEMLTTGKKNTIEKMAHHVTHFGVHDHGFNNLSTYGNLLRAARAGLFEASAEEQEFYKMAIKASGAVQARRWTRVKDGGYMYSFNGPHSLFIDTMRTCRILLAAHKLGHRMLEENDVETNLLVRAITHGLTTAKYAVYYGEGRDHFDVPGRVAHESIFNVNDGNFRCPNSQQGFSGFTTWTRGLAWAMLGFSEFLEFLDTLDPALNLGPDLPGLDQVKAVFLKAARATCDFYMDHSASDGIPYWDTGAPQIHRLGDYSSLPSDPFNDFEPVDSSAAAIGAQGLIRLGSYLDQKDPEAASTYTQAGLNTLSTLLSESYLSLNSDHQGILLHSVYHQPNGWDHIPEGRKVPCGESSMWGDYHMTELCYLIQQISQGSYYTFFDQL
jgi:hypothetical protein